jgi:hypothetical protein
MALNAAPQPVRDQPATSRWLYVLLTAGIGIDLVLTGLVLAGLGCTTLAVAVVMGGLVAEGFTVCWRLAGQDDGPS